ncbi:DUF2059 domain-containing protein [Soonwooa sp.]|uniref:DUF2059 domain-containing protein n=1 Tax=Soonwooa sp. TaxID=1938592 RepID=UPI002601A48A|nr:DUF2059 domain-containing protein [Soonwooa sp.]
MKKIFLVSAFLVSAISFAQTKEQKVEKLLDLMGTTSNMKLMFEQMMNQYQKSYSSVPSAYWEKVRLKVNYKELQSKVAIIYANHFTEEDIDGLIKFYETPLGKKTIKELPLIMQESMTAGQEWGMEIARKVLEDLDKDDSIKTMSPPPQMPSKSK